MVVYQFHLVRYQLNITLFKKSKISLHGRNHWADCRISVGSDWRQYLNLNLKNLVAVCPVFYNIYIIPGNYVQKRTGHYFYLSFLGSFDFFFFEGAFFFFITVSSAGSISSISPVAISAISLAS